MGYYPVYASQSNESYERLVQELWKMGRTFQFESRLDLKIWAGAISHVICIRNRLPASCIDIQVPRTLWINQKPCLKRLLKFGKSGYAFQYRTDCSDSKRFSTREIFGHFVRLQRGNVLYKIYSPTVQSNQFYRIGDFRVLNQNVQLPTFSTLLDQMSKQKAPEDSECMQESHSENVFSKCYFAFMQTFCKPSRPKVETTVFHLIVKKLLKQEDGLK